MLALVLAVMFQRFLSPNWSLRLPCGPALPRLIIIGSLLLVVPIIFVGIYNQPCPADDFGNSDWTDFFGTQKIMYLHWSGRYFNNLVLLLCPLHWHSFSAYRWVIIGVMIALFCLFTLLVAVGLKTFSPAPRLVRLAAGMSASALVFNNMESLAEGFFWYAGAFTYTVPAILFLLFAWLALRLNARISSKISLPVYITASLLVISVVGGNETMLLLCDVVCFLLLLQYRSVGQPELRRFYTFLGILCIICTAVAVLAPGNFQRQSVNPRNVWMVFPTWLFYSHKLAIKWLFDPFLLVFSILFLVLMHDNQNVRPRVSLLAAFLLPFGLVFLLSFPGHYGLGTAPPPRINNIVYLFFVAGWVFFLLQLNSVLQRIPELFAGRSEALRQMLAIATIILLLSSFNTHELRASNFYKVVKGLAREVPQHYREEVDRRFAFIRNATTDTVAVADLRYKMDNVLYLADIITRASSSSNRSIARYCGKAAVYIAPDSLVFPAQMPPR